MRWIVMQASIRAACRYEYGRGWQEWPELASSSIYNLSKKAAELNSHQFHGTN